MLQVGIDKILPVTEARANIARLVDEVEHGNIYVITRGGKPAAVVVPIDKAEKILENVQNVEAVGNVQADRNVQNAEFVDEDKTIKNFDAKPQEIIPNLPKKEDLTIKKEEQSQVLPKQEEENTLVNTKPDNEKVPAGIDMNKVEAELNKIRT